MIIEVRVDVPDGRECRQLRRDCDYLDRGVKNHYCSLFGRRLRTTDGYKTDEADQDYNRSGIGGSV